MVLFQIISKPNLYDFVQFKKKANKNNIFLHSDAPTTDYFNYPFDIRTHFV